MRKNYIYKIECGVTYLKTIIHDYHFVKALLAIDIQKRDDFDCKLKNVNFTCNRGLRYNITSFF